MKLTNTQFATLRWLADVGGVAVCWRNKIVYPAYAASVAKRQLQSDFNNLTGPKRYEYPAVSALHLVQAGYIEAKNRQLHITDYGRRALKP